MQLGDIPILSFFTGAGFLDIGFARADFNIIWHNENDPAFADGFEFGMRALFGEDDSQNYKVQNRNSILEISSNEIAEEAFTNTPKPETFGVD